MLTNRKFLHIYQKGMTIQFWQMGTMENTPYQNIPSPKSATLIYHAYKSIQKWSNTWRPLVETLLQ